jgi:hypothetical protein
MDKEAAIAQNLLKALGSKPVLMGAGGLALAGGGAAVGHKFGVRSGATRMGNQMAMAFSEANAKENKAIVDSFKAFNKKENANIARSFYNQGMIAGARQASGGVVKAAELTTAEKAVAEELEKIGFPVGMVRKAVVGAGKALGASFKRLGTGLAGAGRQFGRAAAQPKGAGYLRNMYAGRGFRQAGQAIASSPGAAITLTGLGAYGLGRRGRTNRTIVEHQRAA